MKKILLILFLLLSFLSVNATDFTAKEEEKANYLLDKAQKSKSVDDFNECIEYYLKLSKKYNEPINVAAMDSAVYMNIERFDTVQDLKYKNLAQKYAKISINNGTDNLNTIIAGITLAAWDLNTNEMIRYYDHMCKVNQKACLAIKNEFSKQMLDVRNQIATNKANASALRWGAFYSLLNVYMQNRPSYSTYSTTGVVDSNGFINLNTVSY